ncbi:hypothetical protein CEUSTIGMA_g1747.t1 [Chlamydomonas eustigma]|uniref:Pescadillo homolog n=1 Tax=Chlamydomonas eustigma TaxID=1157962 RepID=A0A250WTZ0_9CHLO|nr:hypothetical protein CEUSTIGMA_g1747.t1 [Chlamydomonas eustigma]|eukprot:GAX74298.1 hypothetical protein CEUSTIGMA_g1747.t1 [Chlamydomonas eustigma]
MGKKLKRGKAGNAVQYLTRTKAIRKLQLRLGEFRRLCILKGIHPREPKKKVHGANKTYYHIKDINFLLHEPLLQTFRNLKVYDRKIKKAKAKHNEELAERLRSLKPGYKVDHLVKERYPSFVDAIRDLDDPLTMVNLFATLPAEKRYEIPTKAVHMARRLSMEFNAYVVRTNALRKVFVSIKGFYYQAEILGQSVTWLVPHQLAQVLPVDVDYRVMLTFLEFYETMLQFVNFKLYHAIGLRYPPTLDHRMENAAEELASIMKDLAGVQGAVNQQVQEQKVLLQQLEQEESAKRKLLNGQSLTSSGQVAEHDMEEEEDEEDVDSEDDVSDGEPPVIDSGDDEDEDEEDEEEEEGGEDEGTAPVRKQEGGYFMRDGVSSVEVAGVSGQLDDGEEAAGGALGMDAEDEASVCGALFKGLVFFLAREVPREPLLLVIRAFGGTVAWAGEGSPMGESDEAITHQVVDRPVQGHRFLSRRYVQPQWVLDSANFRVLMPSDLYIPGKVPPPHLSPFVNDDEEGYTPDFAVTVKKLQEAAKAARLRACGAQKSGEDDFVGEGVDGGADQVKPDVHSLQDADAVEEEYLADLKKELKVETAMEEDEEEHVEASGLEGGEEAVKVKSKATRGKEVDEVEKMKDIMMTRKNRKLYERIKRAQEGKKECVEILETRKRSLEKGSSKGGPGKKLADHQSKKK